MNNKTPIKQCPTCTVYAAINSALHCTNKNCTWNQCTCGTTYDRYTARSFTTRTTK